MLKDLKVVVDINITPLHDNVCAMVRCNVEIPEKDPIGKEKPMLFVEERSVITTTHLSSWEIYDEIIKTVANLFDVLSKKVERFKLYGRKVE